MCREGSAWFETVKQVLFSFTLLSVLLSMLDELHGVPSALMGGPFSDLTLTRECSSVGFSRLEFWDEVWPSRIEWMSPAFWHWL